MTEQCNLSDTWVTAYVHDPISRAMETDGIEVVKMPTEENPGESPTPGFFDEIDE